MESRRKESFPRRLPISDPYYFIKFTFTLRFIYIAFIFEMISSIISYNVRPACKFLQYKIPYIEKEIIYGIENNDVLLITAETGSGKTTRIFTIYIEIPQFLIQAGYTIGNKKIGVVLPRKIAAITIAKRVADELGCYNC